MLLVFLPFVGVLIGFSSGNKGKFYCPFCPLVSFAWSQFNGPTEFQETMVIQTNANGHLEVNISMQMVSLLFFPLLVFLGRSARTLPSIAYRM